MPSGTPPIQLSTGRGGSGNIRSPSKDPVVITAGPEDYSNTCGREPIPAGDPSVVCSAPSLLCKRYESDTLCAERSLPPDVVAQGTSVRPPGMLTAGTTQAPMGPLFGPRSVVAPTIANS